MFEACATFKLRDGTRALAEAIAADGDFEIRLESTVASIAGATVTLADGEQVHGEAVIVTLPLHALRGLDVELSDGKRAAIEAGQASKGVKSWIRLRGEHEPFVALGGADWPITFLQTEYWDGGDTLVVGFGPDARRDRRHRSRGGAGAGPPSRPGRRGRGRRVARLGRRPPVRRDLADAARRHS